MTSLAREAFDLDRFYGHRNPVLIVCRPAKSVVVGDFQTILPLILIYLVKDINDNAASARQCDPSNHQKMTQDSHLVSRQTNTAELRLSRVEDTIQKLIPITQAFEAWLRANNHIPPSGLPCVDHRCRFPYLTLFNPASA